MADDHDGRQFTVLVNDEEQYSLWPSANAVPAGWRPAGFAGDREACMAFVDEAWTDMRPKSLRIAMGE
ncbi:MAG TPA: MbtH family NRPS accessory protein [Caulobacter sp.]|nr:MbtH family NRPS accessory protein [Caulobacter sp.]